MMSEVTQIPLVTIAIPSYNHEQYIQDAIKSALNQTYENIELIIIDDGSTDDSVNKIKDLLTQCKDRFVRFEFRHRTNKGLCNTLNETLEWANGEYFCTLASDDLMLPEKVAIQIESFNKYPNAAAICGGFKAINEKNQITSTRVNPFKIYDFQTIFLHMFDLPASSQMIKTQILKEVKGFNPNTKVEDFDLWLKLSKLNKEIIYIPYLLIHYRLHDKNFSKNLDLMYNEIIKILNNYKEDKNYPKALYRVQKIYKVRPIQKKSPFKATILRLKYYLTYILSKAV